MLHKRSGENEDVAARAGRNAGPEKSSPRCGRDADLSCDFVRRPRKPGDPFFARFFIRLLTVFHGFSPFLPFSDKPTGR